MNLKITNQQLGHVSNKYCRLVLTEDNQSAHRLVEKSDGTLEYQMGAGKWNRITPRTFRTLLRSIVQAAKQHQIEYLAVQLSNSPFPKLDRLGEAWVLSTIAENFIMAAYEYKRYKTKKEDSAKELKEILICGGLSKEAKAGFLRGQIVGEATSITRDIANATGEHMTPSKLAQAAKAALKGTSVKVTVFDETKIKALKMGLLHAVGKGADDKPRFIIMEYTGSKKDEKPIVLIGKGITYDTGGLNVKPSGHMHDMHLDMSGGASVIGAMQAIAKLKLKRNVIGLIPAAENAISDRAMRAGDIVTSMSGKTVEVVHTDAEGRMVLADALTYAEKNYASAAILDMATLTGASLVALGKYASAYMTKDEKLESTLSELGEESGDLVWPLPLWDEYKASIKSARADISNIDPTFARTAGTIEAGVFLSYFAPKNVPWAHIDIAPRMETIPSDKLTKGAAGEPVRLLVKFVEEWK